MDTEILKPKDLADRIYFKQDTLDFIFKVVSYEQNLIKIQVLLNIGEFSDKTDKIFEVGENEFKAIISDNNFKELEPDDFKKFKSRQEFFRTINKLNKHMPFLSKTFGEEKKEWKLNPKPQLMDRIKNEDSIRRMMSFMDLDHVTIRNILINILDIKYYEILTEGNCKKTVEDGKPFEVSINHYDSIVISWSGIYFRPEHGDNVTLLEGYVVDGILSHFADLDLWDPNK